MNDQILWLAWTGIVVTPWKVIGWTGAGMFAARWLVQIWATRRAGKSVIPRTFWYMSIFGSATTLAYFIFSAKQDSVGVLQNVFPCCTAIYSLYLDIKHHGWDNSKSWPGIDPGDVEFDAEITRQSELK